MYDDDAESIMFGKEYRNKGRDGREYQ